MKRQTNPLHLALEDTLPAAGFFRKGDSWFRRTDETVEVVNLQKSSYGVQYYLNYAIWIRALGEELFPKEELCHIRMRADSIIPSQEQFGRLLDFESATPDPQRRSELANLISQELLPFMESGRSMNGLKSLFTTDRLKKAMIHARARALLKPPSTI